MINPETCYELYNTVARNKSGGSVTSWVTFSTEIKISAWRSTENYKCISQEYKELVFSKGKQKVSLNASKNKLCVMNFKLEAFGVCFFFH